jgi:hypothetical protein
MATIADAIAAAVLEVYELPSWEPRLAVNELWVASEFWDVFDSMPELHDMNLSQGRRTIGEHVEQMLSDFRCSARPGAGDLRQMIPNRFGIRKLHPVAARVYGWCPRPRSFVAVTLALESATKNDRSLNDKKRDEVRAFIAKHHLGQSVLLGDILAVFPPTA